MMKKPLNERGYKKAADTLVSAVFLPFCPDERFFGVVCQFCAVRSSSRITSVRVTAVVWK